ncbi:MAG: COX15/CtaA family protein [Sporichthyaceae bacterium]|nr:COX15/CtaA family protein [Sporichthyaceae bacterium]
MTDRATTASAPNPPIDEAGQPVPGRVQPWYLRALATFWYPAPASMRGWAIASVVANIGIIVTGGAVRLSKSGLGCPTWPSCAEGDYVVRPEAGLHGAIEFGNRMLTFVVGAVVVLTVVAAWRFRPVRRSLRGYALALALGVPAQAVIGGITVLTDLNPWVVMLHLLCSMVLVGLAVTLVRRVSEGDGPARRLVPHPIRLLALGVLATTAVVVYLGAIVTGSGPHSGDEDAVRTGLDPETVSQLHGDAVLVLVGLTIGLLVGLRAVAAPARAVRAAAVLLAVELGQGLVGVVQYATDLPELLVGVHMLGAALTVAAATNLVLATRHRGAAPAAADRLGIRIEVVDYDHPDAARLVQEGLRDEARRYGSEDETPVDAAEFIAPAGRFLVAYLDGVAMACAGWREHRPDAELKRMYVAPAGRGRGLARELLAAIEQSARSAGHRRVILETGFKQPEAVALYRSAGYTDIPNFGFYADEPGCICLGKDLGTDGTT